MPEIMFAQEAADYLRMSYVTLETWRRDGKGPQWFKPEGKVLYHKEDLDAWLRGEQK